MAQIYFPKERSLTLLLGPNVAVTADHVIEKLHSLETVAMDVNISSNILCLPILVVLTFTLQTRHISL